MRRALVLIMALTLLVCAACARADAASDAAGSDYFGYALESMSGSLSAAWAACTEAFLGSLERVRDDSVLREGWDALGARLSAVGDSLRAGALELQARLGGHAVEWSDALSDWLAEHGPALETAAERSGQLLADALNSADAALNGAGDALRSALDGLQVGE